MEEVTREEFNQLVQEIENIKFWQEQLFEGSNMGRLIYESKITRKQYSTIMDIMDEYRGKIDKGEVVSSGAYESDIYRRVYNASYGDYHLCEDIALCLWEDNRWGEVFIALYGDSPKFQNRILQGN